MWKLWLKGASNSQATEVLTVEQCLYEESFTRYCTWDAKTPYCFYFGDLLVSIGVATSLDEDGLPWWMGSLERSEITRSTATMSHAGSEKSGTY